MFDNSQKTNIDTIDDRILPNKGIISLWKLANYSGCVSFYDKPKHDEYIRSLVKEFEQHNIPIIKIGDDMSVWIVRLEDIKPLVQ